MTSPLPGVKMRDIRYLKMLMILSHLVVKVKAGNHRFSLLPMNHTKLVDAQNMELSRLFCADVSVRKGVTNLRLL